VATKLILLDSLLQERIRFFESSETGLC